jgi:hypothetical protein
MDGLLGSAQRVDQQITILTPRAKIGMWRSFEMTQHKDTMIGKSHWANEQMKRAVSNGNLSEARKYSEISSAYNRAAGKYCGRD